MAVNLGSAAYEAITNLKNNPDWRQIVTALEEQFTAFVNRALECPAGNERMDNTGYARALRDLVAHIEQVETQTQRTPKPAVKARTGSM